MAERQDCHQADGDCEVETQATCFSCGEPVCLSCSRLLKYITYGRRRLCHTCIESRFENGAAFIETSIRRRSGDVVQVPRLVPS